MARQTAQSWLIPWPLGTPASQAPGNTCGCPSHVVRDEPDAWRWYGSLGCESRKEIIFFCVFSAPVSFGRCGSRVSGSFPDLRLHTRWDSAPISHFWLLLTGVWAQSPLTCRWMVYWPHLQATKCALHQLCGDDWKNFGYVMTGEHYGF